MARAQATAWILQGNPKEWDLGKFARDVRDGRADARVAWLVGEEGADMQPGDRVFLWSMGDDRTAGIIATANVVEAPADIEESQAQYRRVNSAEKFAGSQLRAVIEVDRVLPKTLFRVKLQWDPELKGRDFLEAPEGETVPLTAEDAALLEARCDAVRPPRGHSRSAA